MKTTVRSIVALCVLAIVHLGLCQDVLLSPPAADNTITWVGCAADDSNYASMNVQDDVSKIDLDYTAFTDLQISPCEGELVMKFGQQVTIGDDTEAPAREGAIRFREESELTEDLEYRKNGEWVSLTTYIADSESKVLQGTRIPNRNQRLFYIDFEGSDVFTNFIPSVPVRTNTVTGEITSVLHGVNAFFCDISTDSSCASSRVIDLNAIIADVDIDSSSRALFTASNEDKYLESLDQGPADSLWFFQCDTPQCAAVTQIEADVSEFGVLGVPVSVTLPEDTFHTFFFSEDFHLIRYSSFEDDSYVVLNGTAMLDADGFEVEDRNGQVDARRLHIAIARNETSGASVDDYYVVAAVPLRSNAVNSTIPPVIASFNDAVWRLLVLRCSQASGCADEETFLERTYIPNTIADHLLLGALDSDSQEYSHEPLAVQATIVDDNGSSRLFIVVAMRRKAQDAPPREMNQALVSIMSFLCEDPLCSTYTAKLLTDSNDWHDSNQVSSEKAPFDELTIRLETSEFTGLPVIAVTSLRSAPFVLSCHDVACIDSELNVMEERLSSRARHLRSEIAYTPGPLWSKAPIDTTISGTQRDVRGTIGPGDESVPGDAFPIALHAGPDFITVLRLGNSQFEVHDQPSRTQYSLVGKQRALVLQFANATVAPDGLTRCDAQTVGRFLNAAGKIFACTRLPKKPLENNIGDSDAIISATRLYQWSPIGGNARHLFSTHVLANERNFESGSAFRPNVTDIYWSTQSQIQQDPN